MCEWCYRHINLFKKKKKEKAKEASKPKVQKVKERGPLKKASSILLFSVCTEERLYCKKNFSISSQLANFARKFISKNKVK